MDFKIAALVLLVGLMAGFAFGSDAQITGMATGGGGTHIRTEIPGDVAFVDSSGVLVKNIDSSPAVAAEARKVDTKAGVVISGNLVQANTISTYATQSTTYLYTPEIYTGTVKAWSKFCNADCATPCQIGPNPGCYKVVITQSGSGVSIDTKGGEITTGKMNVGSGGNVITTDVLSA